MEYRPLKKQDVAEVFYLGKQDFASKLEYSWDWCVAKIKQYLDKSFGFGIVCVEENSVIGFVLIENNYSSQKPDVAWLTYIFVDEKYRSKSIGRHLLE